MQTDNSHCVQDALLVFGARYQLKHCVLCTCECNNMKKGGYLINMQATEEQTKPVFLSQ